ncbi:hypothetical protein [Fodinicola acaciae]|uniref:hypothetical protein n=1 Tax=Fodinicola acaciae TaxID=2681555 RepID=UPI0013D4C26E|nr:hypothetical protein [Fodinicola acaciae]
MTDEQKAYAELYDGIDTSEYSPRQREEDDATAPWLDDDKRSAAEDDADDRQPAEEQAVRVDEEPD